MHIIAYLYYSLCLCVCLWEQAYREIVRAFALLAEGRWKDEDYLLHKNTVRQSGRGLLTGRQEGRQVGRGQEAG